MVYGKDEVGIALNKHSTLVKGPGTSTSLALDGVVPALRWGAELAGHHDRLPACAAAARSGWALTVSELLSQPTSHC